MAKHDGDNSASQRHFDESLAHRIAGILAELEGSKFDESGVYVPDPVGEKRPSASDVNVFGGWMSARSSDVRATSRSEASAGRKRNADPTSEPSVNYVASNIQNARSYKHHGKAVEVDYLGASVCRACVETNTYRYVHNNGRYRSSKALAQRYGHQKATRRLADARTLNPEQKKLQKEIQRELRREFGLAEEKSQMEDREKNWGAVARRDDEGSPAMTSRGPPNDDDERAGSRELGDPDRAKSGESVGEHVKCSTPLALPAISVPLVRTDGHSHAVDISCMASQLEAFRDRNSGTDEARRTRRGLFLGVRSRSEPPPGGARVGSGTADRASLVNFEVVPTSLRRDVTPSSAQRNRGSGGRRGGRLCPEADALCLNKYSEGWTPRESTCLPLDVATSAGHLDPAPNGAGLTTVEGPAPVTPAPVADDKRKQSERARTRRNAPSDGSDPADPDAVSLSQIRYMAASGEVSSAPKFGARCSEEIPAADRSNNCMDGAVAGEKIQNVMTTKFRTSLPNKHASKEVASPKHKSHALRNHSSNVLTDFSSGKLVSGGFRAYPVGQVKITEKKASDHPRPEDLDILPKISGRKVTMAVTSHRIV